MTAMTAVVPTFQQPPRPRASRRQSAGLGWLGLGVAALLGSALRLRSLRRSPRGRVALGSTALTVGLLATKKLIDAGTTRGRSRAVAIDSSVTIRRAPSEVYAYWRELKHLPEFMTHLQSVSVDGDVSTWRAQPVAGLELEWQAEIVEDRQGQGFSWRSLPGSSLPKRGAVRFASAPGGRGTEVHLNLEYEPPAGPLGRAFARLFGALPAMQVEADLRRLKQILETGEVVRSDASIHQGLHPARPLARPFSGNGGQLS